MKNRYKHHSNVIVKNSGNGKSNSKKMEWNRKSNCAS
jgi:hypothetical protein